MEEMVWKRRRNFFFACHLSLPFDFQCGGCISHLFHCVHVRVVLSLHPFLPLRLSNGSGYILGSGILISPSKERIVYYWADAKQPMSLPSLVRHYLDGREEDRALNDQRQLEMFAQLRAVQLREYVAGIRNQLYQERVAEKRSRYQEAVQKVKEQKAKLYETRLKALVGEEEDEATSTNAGGSRPNSSRASSVGVSEEGGEEDGEEGGEEEGGDGSGRGEEGGQLVVAESVEEDGGRTQKAPPAQTSREPAPAGGSAPDKSRKAARPKDKPKDRDKSSGKGRK